MATLIEFQKKLQPLTNRKVLEEMLFLAIKETKNVAESLQKQQLGEGRSNEDEIIGTYARSTELEYIFGGRQSRKPKIEGEPYNFEDTGGFIDGITTIFEKDQVSFWSTDEKTPLLVSKYDNLLGLDDYNLSKYVLNSVFPIFENNFLKRLGLR